MTLAASAISTPTASLRPDWPFVAAPVVATALLCALVLIDGQPRSAALVIAGFALGVAFLKAEFSFTAAWRRFLVTGEAGGLLAALLLIGVAALVIVPVAALGLGFGGAIAPLGPSLVVGAFVFGIGMQLGNGCGSGTLYTAGGGSGRMLVTLLFFIVGSVVGSLHLPFFLALGGIDPILASDYLGPWGGLAVTLVSLAAAALVIAMVARRRGANFTPSRTLVVGAIVIGALAVAAFLAGGHPWSVTFGFTVWGGKIATLLGFDLSGAEFWQWPGPKRALAESVLTDTSSLTDFGMIFGAMAAAAAAHPYARAKWPALGSLLAAAVGGLLMGWGARIGFGCNIGAFLGGVASGSLHGWVWFLAALAGCTIGIRLRPLFGLAKV
ncbi:YeeE/YedE family protein [Xanthobacteraceae bacterium Astr-EGSB]|uniref:YeeE/YedE family protein n=1 Tax=Astrobacterium formosum TaxID=3069710 RepID=UPI0027AE3E84|nr:YeeE/YedE family protein [Xanthobacteraceae bacterium Astr-EGSB]